MLINQLSAHPVLIQSVGGARGMGMGWGGGGGLGSIPRPPSLCVFQQDFRSFLSLSGFIRSLSHLALLSNGRQPALPYSGKNG